MQENEDVAIYAFMNISINTDINLAASQLLDYYFPCVVFPCIHTVH